MRRRPLVAGNWKMHKTILEAREAVDSLLPLLDDLEQVEVVVCPPFVALAAVAERLKGTRVQVGAQHMHWEEKGAFTGEVSPRMLVDLCRYVIVAHSERRTHFGETDETARKRVASALRHGLTPILCVGETLPENEQGRTASVVTGQVRAALEGLPAAEAEKVVVAYEPVWAIGSGRPATPEFANAVAGDFIRHELEWLFGRPTAEAVRVLYGGSVTPENARAFFEQVEIDGALVGGASLDPQLFAEIARAAA